MNKNNARYHTITGVLFLLLVRPSFGRAPDEAAGRPLSFLDYTLLPYDERGGC